MIVWKVYKIINKISGKVYIGVTCTKLETRWKFHCKYGAGELHEDILQFGDQNFEVDTVCSCRGAGNAKFLEKYFIEEFQSYHPNGYNRTAGGEGIRITAGRNEAILVRLTNTEKEAFGRACWAERSSESGLGGKIITEWLRKLGYLSSKPSSPSQSILTMEAVSKALDELP